MLYKELQQVMFNGISRDIFIQFTGDNRKYYLGTEPLEYLTKEVKSIDILVDTEVVSYEEDDEFETFGGSFIKSNGQLIKIEI